MSAASPVPAVTSWPPVNEDERGQELAAFVLDYEMSAPLDGLRRTSAAGETSAVAWLLLRRHHEPLGWAVIDIPPEGVDGEALETLVRSHVGSAVPRTAPAEPTSHQDATSARRTWPAITVVVCTRDKPELLSRCLDSLTALEYPLFSILVVDNAPSDSRTRELVAHRRSPVRIDYAVEPLPGLSRARNLAVDLVATPVVAWIDDDEVADRWWLTEIARAFEHRPDADAVSGLVVPGELRTTAQVLFETFGGHSKGRGFVPAVFSRETAHDQSPLYPLPPFGVGANMAFRTDSLRRTGPFDTSLGAGTATCGGEDTQMFTRLLLDGGVCVYHPGAVTRHFHRPDLAGLEAQMYGYGVGLSAYYTSLLWRRPGLVGPLLRLAPRALSELVRKDSTRNAGVSAGFPRRLMRRNLAGLLRGPVAYRRARRTARRAELA